MLYKIVKTYQIEKTFYQIEIKKQHFSRINVARQLADNNLLSEILLEWLHQHPVE